MTAKRIIALCVCALLLCIPLVSAQTDALTSTPLETAEALARAALPPRDRVALAESLLGITVDDDTAAIPPAAQLGDRGVFTVRNADTNSVRQIEAYVAAVGKHVVMWVESGTSELPHGRLQALVTAFDTQIYEPVRALWGSERVPGIDGDPRVHILFATDIGSSLLAYYASEHSYPASVVPTSSEREMFIVNLDTFAQNFDGRWLESILAHEFQHMIRDHVQSNLDTWLNEGFSTFTQFLLYGDFDMALAFLYAPDTQLNAWSPEPFERSADYGAALLFTIYFYERYGLQALQMLSQSGIARGLDAFDATLNALGAPGVDVLFADWVAANYLLGSGAQIPGLTYTSLPPGMPLPTARAQAQVYPFAYAGALSQYATDYFELSVPPGARALEISLDLPSITPLIDVPAASGQRFWYSSRGDDSVSTLTCAFDLRSVQTAALEYAVWHSLEESWDYGYLLLSRDGGRTWDVIAADGMTDRNPNQTAYGTGYSGTSGGWVRERVALDAYAGSEVLIRFATITDDAITLAGMAIDDVRLIAAGYSEDFESADGGWSGAGWVWVENALPQQAWVQAIEWDGTAPRIERWQTVGSSRWSMTLRPGAERVVLAVSPFAPVTLTPVGYSLRADFDA